jgi:glycosyltransferase involved in cell wall biosynthesis
LVIHSSDILVHCSLREGLARALPQGMLAGKPVISFDIDGAKEVVNENTGRLIPPEDVDALTEASRELIADKDLRQKLGENARRSVVKQFAPETMVDTIEGVYRQILPDYE